MEGKESTIKAGYEKTRAHVVITGRVQGVFFRSTLRSKAKLYEIRGWTRNRQDGSVEALFEGDPDRVQKMITFCWEGPPGAEVDNVDVEYKKPRMDLTGFEIKH
ncbi:MAG: acylphosphatase [Candidatus Aenigmatarchaeota archaeon]|nr:MAG: acylphosphatase [Candidatus Aenigmarchaeota archaeon]